MHRTRRGFCRFRQLVVLNKVNQNMSLRQGRAKFSNGDRRLNFSISRAGSGQSLLKTFLPLSQLIQLLSPGFCGVRIGSQQRLFRSPSCYRLKICKQWPEFRLRLKCASFLLSPPDTAFRCQNLSIDFVGELSRRNRDRHIQIEHAFVCDFHQKLLSLRLHGCGSLDMHSGQRNRLANQRFGQNMLSSRFTEPAEVTQTGRVCRMFFTADTLKDLMCLLKQRLRPIEVSSTFVKHRQVTEPNSITRMPFTQDRTLDLNRLLEEWFCFHRLSL